MFLLILHCLLLIRLSVGDTGDIDDKNGIREVKELLEREFSERKRSDDSINNRLESIETRLIDIQEHNDNERQWRQNIEEFMKDILEKLKATKEEKACGNLPELPGKPRQVRLAAVNSSTVFVQWQPSRVKDGVNIRGYYVYYSQVDEELNTIVGTEKTVDIVSGSVTQTELCDLLPKTRYNVSVAAYTKEGIGDRSRPKTVKTLGEGPSEPRLKVHQFSGDPPKARLSWEPESPNEQVIEYKLVWGRKGQIHEQVNFDKNTLSWISPDLDADALYEFRLSAKNEAGYGPNAVSELRIPAALRITLPPRNMRAVEGGIVSFFCKASGLTTLEFAWERKGRPLSSYPRRIQIFSIKNGTVLRIEPTKVRDNGFFTCVVKGSHSEARANATLKVYEMEADEIQGYPVIVESPVLRVAEKGQNAVLKCSARSENATSPLTIYWLKDSQPVNVEDPRISVNNPGSLAINRVRETDNARYECVAENDVGVAYSFSAMLYVRVRHIPPKFPRTLDDIITAVNRTVFAECIAVGSPMPVVYWKHNFQTLNQSDAPAYGRNVLVLTNVQISDRYTCVAESKFGTIEQDLEVLIADPGTYPSNVRAEIVARDTVQVYWDEPEKPDGVIQGYKIYYTRDPNQQYEAWLMKDLKGTSKTTTITDLMPDEIYTFTVLAYTKEGQGPKSIRIQMAPTDLSTR